MYAVHIYTYTHTDRKDEVGKVCYRASHCEGNPGGRSLLAQPPVSDGSDVVTRIKRQVSSTKKINKA